MRYMGIDIGGTKCAVVIGNEDKILKKIRFDTTNKEETILNILSAVEQLGTADAVGISCGGPLDTCFLFDRFIAMMGGNKECR